MGFHVSEFLDRAGKAHLFRAAKDRGAAIAPDDKTTEVAFAGSGDPRLCLGGRFRGISRTGTNDETCTRRGADALGVELIDEVCAIELG